MPIADLRPEIAVLLAAVVILLHALFAPRRWQWLGAPLALLGLIAAIASATAQLGTTRLTFSGVWALDGSSTWGRLLIVAASVVAVVITPGWLAEDRRHGEYYAMLLLSALGAMLLAGASDTLELIMGALLASVTGYTLAAYHRDWAPSLEAGMKFFLIGALTNALLVIGITWLFGLYGTTAYSEMAAGLRDTVPAAMTLTALALVIIGLAFKLAAVPAHAWMPDVAEGAPAPAAAFLTVVPKIGAAVALTRLVAVFPAEAIDWRAVLAVISVATMTLGNLGALWQEDVRRLLGWSSVSQSGYALMAVTVVGLSAQALPALLYFLAAYAAANLAAFAVVTHLRGRTKRSDYRGLASAHPWAAAVLVLSFLSLVGIPPLAGFVGKLVLFIATLDAGYTWLAVVAVINTVVSLFYYLRVLGPMYFDEPPAPVAVLGGWSAVGVALGGVAVVVVGLGAHALWVALTGVTLLR